PRPIVINSLAQAYPAGELLFVRIVFILPWLFLLVRRACSLRALRIEITYRQSLRGIYATEIHDVSGVRV
ncbi:MAG: hypothetical protein ACR2OX_12795, partial [Methyloligellaceae bacterium]